MRETKNCVRHPDRKAIEWTGHVVDKRTGEKVLAGWCSRRYKEELDIGYFGLFLPSMGKRESL